jgi:hypothetical protein
MSTIPMAWPGSDEAAQANRETHWFITYQYDEDSAETRCSRCDCRPSHIAASWPCGIEPPRIRPEDC